MAKKIDEMHRRFGILSGERCGDCSNLISGRYRTKYLSKCTVYGCTHSEATDWRKKNVACGMFNKEWKGKDIIRCISPEKEDIGPIEGQECMFDVDQ